VGSFTAKRWQSAASVPTASELAAKLESLREAYGKDRKPLQLKEGRDLLESASLPPPAGDFASDPTELHGLDLATAQKVIDAAQVFRPDVSKPCDVLDAASTRLLAPDAVNVSSMPEFAKLAHTLCVLRTPLVFDVLVAHIPRVLAAAKELDVRSLALIANAYGRTGTRHAALYDALTARTVEVARECTVLPQLANMCYAFALSGCRDPAVYKALGDAALPLTDQAVPLVVATIFEAFATAEQSHEELFQALEKHAAGKIDECSPPLLSSLLLALAKLKRAESPVMDSAAKRAAKIAPAFDPTSIAKCLRAFQLLGVENDEFFGAMAERSCAVWGEFSAKDIAMTTAALAHFELYDAELFPLLARRTLYLVQKRYAVNVGDLASILGSFAAVHDRNDDLISGASRLLFQKHELLTGASMITLLWAFATLNVKNDLANLLIVARKRITPADIAQDKKRWEVATQTWPELLTEPKEEPPQAQTARWKGAKMEGATKEA
jgi:hypothetical protein